MDHTKVLKRAWHILWHYRVLWLFGFLLALTTASYGSTGPSFTTSGADFDREFRGYRLEDADPDLQRNLEQAVEDMIRFFEDGSMENPLPSALPKVERSGTISYLPCAPPRP